MTRIIDLRSVVLSPGNHPQLYVHDAGDYISDTIESTGNWFEGKLTIDFAKYFSECKPNTVFVDLGANIGSHSHCMQLLANPSKIVMVEPLPCNWEVARLNNPKAVVIKAACSDSIGLADFIVPPDEQKGSGRLKEINCEESLIYGKNSSSIKVAKIKLDDIHCGEIGALKIDVEGAELECLKGASESIKKYRPLLWLEIHKDSPRKALILDFLQSYGYNHIMGDGGINYIFDTAN